MLNVIGQIVQQLYAFQLMCYLRHCKRCVAQYVGHHQLGADCRQVSFIITDTNMNTNCFSHIISCIINIALIGHIMAAARCGSLAGAAASLSSSYLGSLYIVTLL